MELLEAVTADLAALASCAPPTGPLAPSALATAAAIAAPHFLYAFIWFHPQAWQRLFPKAPVDAFATAGLLGKLLQFAAVLLWFASLRPDGLCLQAARVSLPRWLGFLLLAGYGQSLNAGIFQAIGKDGVYYGFKLGKRVPWVTGWPFDAVSHPQYVGSAATVWALVLLAWGQAPAAPLLAMSGLWTFVYLVTALQEQYL